MGHVTLGARLLRDPAYGRCTESVRTTLRPGSVGDVAIFEVKQGNFPIYDIEGNIRYGTELLVNTLTIVDGRPLERTWRVTPAPWMAHDFKNEEYLYLNIEFQEELRRRGHVPSAMPRALPEEVSDLTDSK